nr:hypothetical protein CVCH_059 [Cavernulicola chilensis]
MISDSRVINTAFEKKIAFKVISGINNFKSDHVIDVAKAAEAGGATYIDMAASARLIEKTKLCTSLPICVSAIQSNDLIQCLQVGVDIVEIGNYNCFYQLGDVFSSDKILKVARNVKTLLNGKKVLLAVTIPHILSKVEQLSLAVKLELLGINFIQTEGNTNYSEQDNILSLVERASSTLAITYELSKTCNLPIICSSGLSEVTVPMAFSIGASGVGVGNVISTLNTREEMQNKVRQIANSITYLNDRVVQTSKLF